MAAECFVMQPFDGGKYDGRYQEVYEAAIRAAGFSPYRVDHDLSASIPMERIERGIRECSVCFADISEDNPNVWLEVGLAIAHQKELCLVCSQQRKTFPFDIQHRLIIPYNTDMPSDFDALSAKITERLKSISLTLTKIESLPKQILRVSESDDGFNESAVSAIGVLAATNIYDQVALTHWEYRREMEKLGFTDIAANIALMTLRRKSFLRQEERVDHDGDRYLAFGLTDEGWGWVETNLHRFQLRTPPGGKASARALDDDLPF